MFFLDMEVDSVILHCSDILSSDLFLPLTILAECDIRSCLNTLQFLNKKKETLNTVGY